MFSSEHPLHAGQQLCQPIAGRRLIPSDTYKARKLGLRGQRFPVVGAELTPACVNDFPLKIAGSYVAATVQQVFSDPSEPVAALWKSGLCMCQEGRERRPCGGLFGIFRDRRFNRFGGGPPPSVGDIRGHLIARGSLNQLVYLHHARPGFGHQRVAAHSADRLVLRELVADERCQGVGDVCVDIASHAMGCKHEAQRNRLIRKEGDQPQKAGSSWCFHFQAGEGKRERGVYRSPQAICRLAVCLPKV